MKAPRGLEHLGARAGGSCGEEQLGRGGSRPSRLRPVGRPPHPSPPSPNPHLRLCLLAPAGRSLGSEDPWSPHLRPANSEKCETWGGRREGRQKLGASHFFGNLRSSSVLRGRAGTRPPPLLHPEGTSCSVYVCISIYTSVLPGLPPSLGSKSQGVFVHVTHTQSTPLPHPRVSPNLPLPSVLFCMALQL